MHEPLTAPFLPLVPGQDLARRLFERALRLGRMSHAYLFVGPEGSGKRLFARELAKALLCSAGLPCGCCASCRSVDHDNHPGVHVYCLEEGKTVVDIDTVRALCERTHYRREHLQIAILEGAEKLNEPAANALLKTLEEPPEKVLLFLLAQSTGTLLETIVSRCHRIPFTREGVEPPRFSGAQLSLLLAVLEPSFHARHDPRAWLGALIPAETGARNALRLLLDGLLAACRIELEAPFGFELDESLRLLSVLLDLRQDLDSNRNPDLVLERLLLTMRRRAAVLIRASTGASTGASPSGKI